VAAGLLGRYKNWRAFSEKWKRVLRHPPAIKYFHSREWRSLQDEFYQFRDNVEYPKPKGGEAATAKRTSLRSVIESTELIAIGTGVLVEDFNLVRNCDSRAADFFRPDPYEAALQSLVYECAKAVRWISREDKLGDNGHCVGYVSDDSDLASTYTAVYTDFRKKNPDIGQIMRGIAHLDDKKWAGLQAADMIAHSCNQVFKETVKIPEDERVLRQSLPEFQKTFFKIAHMDKWYMCSILEDLKGISLFDKLGIKRREIMSDEELEKAKRSGLARIRPVRV
jgi:hypothetical protein